MTDINNYLPTSGRFIGEDNKTYNIVDLLKQGGGGGSAMEFIEGVGAPDDGTGDDGDVYLNTSNGDLYKKTDGAWDNLINLKGPKGSKGNPGTGEDAEKQFTSEQVSQLLKLIPDPNSGAEG